MGTTPDGRPIPPLQADERAMLESWLDFHRATLPLKCAGLDDRQVRLASVAPSSMTLLGLVQHMAEVERTWFQRVFAGQDLPPVNGAGDGNEGGNEGGSEDGFTLAPDRGIDEALALWHAEVARSRELTAAASLDDTGKLPGREAGLVGGQEVSLRWILVHMIEEYARHNGHADLLRESIDGVTGA
ncbi:DinB family protein [Streptomyces sp. NPDC054765]